MLAKVVHSLLFYLWMFKAIISLRFKCGIIILPYDDNHDKLFYDREVFLLLSCVEEAMVKLEATNGRPSSFDA